MATRSGFGPPTTTTRASMMPVHGGGGGGAGGSSGAGGSGAKARQLVSSGFLFFICSIEEVVAMDFSWVSWFPGLGDSGKVARFL